MHLRLAIAMLALPLYAQNVPDVADNADWHKPHPGFRVVGNVYYVGTYDLASYLITTPQGTY
ncbi:MAG: hypothetical protein ABL995_16405 [Bryobacteraceae bacterium]